MQNSPYGGLLNVFRTRAGNPTLVIQDTVDGMHFAPANSEINNSRLQSVSTIAPFPWIVLSLLVDVIIPRRLELAIVRLYSLPRGRCPLEAHLIL